MCLTHTILDDPDISKPSSSGSSDTLMIVSLPTPPYRTGVLQKLLTFEWSGFKFFKIYV